MRPSSLAIDLDDLAATLRKAASVIRKTGEPIAVPWPAAFDGVKDLHQLDAIDLEEDAAAYEADAAKLRDLYS